MKNYDSSNYLVSKRNGDLLATTMGVSLQFYDHGHVTLLTDTQAIFSIAGTPSYPAVGRPGRTGKSKQGSLLPGGRSSGPHLIWLQISAYLTLPHIPTDTFSSSSFTTILSHSLLQPPRHSFHSTSALILTLNLTFLSPFVLHTITRHGTSTTTVMRTT
jgi:hypothetical protein